MTKASCVIGYQVTVYAVVYLLMQQCAYCHFVSAAVEAGLLRLLCKTDFRFVFVLQHRDWLIQQKFDEFVGSVQLLAVVSNCG